MFRSSFRIADLPAIGALALLSVAPVARANAIDALTLTPIGANTVFAVTGTYTPDTPVTLFSSPNTAYSLIFTLPTTPTDLTFADEAGGFFVIETAALLNGVDFANSEAVFFDSSQGGGFVICLGDACNPDPNIFPHPAFNYWNFLGDQLFSGTPSSPTFLSGPANFDKEQSFYGVTAAPEPSITFLGAGLLGLMALASRKFPVIVSQPIRRLSEWRQQ